MCFKTQGLYKCGKCPECLQERRNEWAIRLIQEAHLNGCFTALLTYDNDHVPLKDDLMSLCKKDVQKFLKRLRHLFPNEKIKYFIAGEYSPEKFRPHYHCLFFGLPKDFENNQIKKILSKAWRLGFIGSRSSWLKDDAQVNYALGYLMYLYDWNDEDPRERPFRLLSKGLSMDYVPNDYIKIIQTKKHFGWYNTITGELVNCSPIVELNSLFPDLTKDLDPLLPLEKIEKKKFKYMPKNWVMEQPISFVDGVLSVDNDFLESVDCCQVQQTHFNYKTRQTTLGKVQKFPLPRRWRESLLSDVDRIFLNFLKQLKADEKFNQYLKDYGDYDLENDFPMWKQIKFQRWKQKKKNKKDKLLNNPDSFL